jgi:hypothetical protein
MTDHSAKTHNNKGHTRTHESTIVTISDNSMSCTTAMYLVNGVYVGHRGTSTHVRRIWRGDNSTDLILFEQR